jgi:3-oxoacyl-[acyl-carrier protein] reductase
MDLNLKGKVAIVTGAGSQIGFGKAIAVTLAREGCDTVLGDMDLEGAQQTASEIKASGGRALAVKVDVTNGSQVHEMVQAALKEFGKIDILVNNAGATSGPKPFIESTAAEWDFHIQVNFTGVLICTKAVLGHMLAQKSGNIINVSSVAGVNGSPMATVYAAAKAGVICFTKGLAAEMGPSGIRVNSVAPGLAKTGFVRNDPPEMLQRAIERPRPAGRLTEPQDIANMVAFFASDVSSDIVGQTVAVSGSV